MSAVKDGTRFTALDDFYDEDLKSHYVQGMSYTVRKGANVLRNKVRKWIDDGKVALIDASGATIKGE